MVRPILIFGKNLNFLKKNKNSVSLALFYYYDSLDFGIVMTGRTPRPALEA